MGPETNQSVNRRAVLAAGSIALVGTSGCASLMSRDIRDQGDGGSHDEHDGSHREDEGGNSEGGESHGEDEGHDQNDGHDEHGGTHHDHVEPIDHPVQYAEVGMVTNDGHHFEPHLVWIEVGGTVTWANESGSYTTTAYCSFSSVYTTTVLAARSPSR